MTKKLLTNRFNQLTPTLLLGNGTSISAPLYINLSTDQAKELINGFREVVREQRLKMGYSAMSESTRGGLAVTDNSSPPETPAELELGMKEDNLRYVLFGRGGSPERLVLKLQELTGIQMVSREDIETAQSLWLNHLFENEKKATKAVSPKPRRTSKPSHKEASS